MESAPKLSRKHIDFRDQISRNKTKSFFLMISVFIVLVALGYAISQAFSPGYFFVIMAISIAISLGYILFNFYNSDKIAIAAAGARPASKERNKQFYDVAESLTIASGLPMPKLYIMKSSQINAFASGRDPQHAVVCITSGSLEKLEKRELEGVLAHEMSHIGNYDVRFMTLITVMVGMVSIISEIFLRSLWFSGRGNNRQNGAILILIGVALAILAPIVVYFIQLSVSRKREFAADASAVRFTRYPRGLIDALKKIQSEQKSFQSSLQSQTQSRQQERKISKALAPMFFSNPFRAVSSTHPPIEKRIRALERM